MEKSWNPQTGELAGVIDARDTVFNEQLDALNELAMKIKTEVNTLHYAGYGLADDAHHMNFFEGDDAGSFTVNTEMDDVENIALSSAEDEPGNNDVARSIYELRSKATMNSKTATFYQYYNDQISKLGLLVTNASSNASNHSLVADALDTQRASVSGVNLNEEAANLVKSQKAYEAAARLVSTLDEMLDTIINGMGAGR